MSKLKLALALTLLSTLAACANDSSNGQMASNTNMAPATNASASTGAVPAKCANSPDQYQLENCIAQDKADGMDADF